MIAAVRPPSLRLLAGDDPKLVRTLATKVAAGEIRLDAGADLDDYISKLIAMPEIGLWIASYIAMRVIGDLHGCSRIERALARSASPARPRPSQHSQPNGDPGAPTPSRNSSAASTTTKCPEICTRFTQ
jgi:hypothetical protein